MYHNNQTNDGGHCGPVDKALRSWVRDRGRVRFPQRQHSQSSTLRDSVVASAPSETGGKGPCMG